MKRLIRSSEVLPHEDLIDDRIRIYKDDNGYSVCFNDDFIALYPLTKDGYSEALDRFFTVLTTEREKYENNN